MELKFFEKPKKYHTRDGREAVIFARGLGVTEATGEKLFGVISCSKNWMEASWSLAGKYDSLAIGDNDFDLVREQ